MSLLLVTMSGTSHAISDDADLILKFGQKAPHRGVLVKESRYRDYTEAQDLQINYMQQIAHLETELEKSKKAKPHWWTELLIGFLGGVAFTLTVTL